MAAQWSYGRAYRERMNAVCTVCGNPAINGRSVCKPCLQRQMAQGVVMAILLGCVAVGVFLYFPGLHGGTAGDKPGVVTDRFGRTHTAVAGGLGGWLYFITQDKLIQDVTHHARLLGTPPVPQHAPQPAAEAGVPAPATAGDAAPALPAAAVPASPAPAATQAIAATPAAAAAKPAAAPSDAATPAAKPEERPHAPTLELSASQVYGKRVTITLPKIKLACGKKPCPLLLSFDDKPPLKPKYLDISSEDATILMSEAYDDIMTLLPDSHELEVEIQLPTGDRLFTHFTTEGLQTNLMK